MRAVVNSYFESKIRREGVSEDGTPCKISELYVVAAVSFTDCEARITKYLSEFASGEFEVLTESHAPFGEVFFSDDGKDDKYYKCRVSFELVDERTAKVKKSKVTYLVQGSSIDSAKRNLDEVMSQGMCGYSVEAIHETAIVDVVNAEKAQEQ